MLLSVLSRRILLSRARVPCGYEQRRVGSGFPPQHHVGLGLLCAWHTWPTNHSDTRLSGTSAPICRIGLPLSYTTPRQNGSLNIFNTMCSSFFLKRPDSKSSQRPSLRVRLKHAATPRHFHGCCIDAEQSQQRGKRIMVNGFFFE